ncbi:hypothetical protein LQT97_13040 [Brucella pseudogrignonensis]|uniref:YiiX/YebB-like N1pC/P60 family cysteine hydrolase n=1 Tax=Brucella pseudogrignonensis TaxID=419475 RepID=UPI001E40EEB1|nr:YiiX/YebB-like N1pC/P60 family cysteine hydrolase [Brucella pseudogrignonensis]MCD4512154.1 hypothetical protein [Brucella pseudogrignonensis]
MRRFGAFIPLLLALALSVFGNAFAAHRFDRWQTGDLIFHESLSTQAAAIRVVTGSPYTHMGIVRQTERGTYVIEAGRTVAETPLEEFIARGTQQNYAVYRVKGLKSEKADSVVNAAKAYYERPYDIFFRLDPVAIYCSELPFYAFQSVGITHGRVERLGDLAIDTPEGRTIFLARWQDHPDCRAEGTDRDGCWTLIQDQVIMTPVSIAEESTVELVFSTFDNAP